MSEREIPKPEDIQKEFEDFVKKRFGGQVKILAQEFPFRAKDEGASEKISRQPIDLNFDHKPKAVKAYLDRFVIGQDEAKKALSIAVCDHYNQVRHYLKNSDGSIDENYSKQNVLILGPTGVGKTYMVRQISKLIGVPFVKADATRFSETGYVGANVDDLIKDLVHQAQGDIQKAQFGIVYLDEADKLASPTAGSMSRDVSGRGVQMGLLKLMEETEIDLKGSHDPASQMQAFLEMQQKGKIERNVVNTRHILFIVSGAFVGLNAIAAKRLNQSAIGFQRLNKTTETDIDALSLTTQDFIDFGFEPEFIGRLPVRVACQDLDAEALFSILKNSEGSIIQQYIRGFGAYGITLRFTDCALHSIAQRAVAEKTGARGLMTILEGILRDYKYHLPSTNILELEVSADLIRDPQGFLKRLLQSLQDDHHSEIKLIREFEKSFANDHAMSIKFDEAAVQYLVRQAKSDGVSVDQLCKNLFQSFEYGLKLIQHNTGRDFFVISEDLVSQPRQGLEKLVKESYNAKLEPVT